MGSTPSKRLGGDRELLKSLNPKNHGSSSKEKPQDLGPPAYESGHVGVPTHTLKSSDIPEWHWTNKQCRDWLTEVFVDGGMEREFAQQQAETLMPPGLVGLSMYQKSKAQWRSVLREEHAESIWALFLHFYGEQNRKGTFPNIVLYQFHQFDRKNFHVIKEI